MGRELKSKGQIQIMICKSCKGHMAYSYKENLKKNYICLFCGNIERRISLEIAVNL